VCRCSPQKSRRSFSPGCQRLPPPSIHCKRVNSISALTHITKRKSVMLPNSRLRSGPRALSGPRPRRIPETIRAAEPQQRICVPPRTSPAFLAQFCHHSRIIKHSIPNSRARTLSAMRRRVRGCFSFAKANSRFRKTENLATKRTSVCANRRPSQGRRSIRGKFASRFPRKVIRVCAADPFW